MGGRLCSWDKELSLNPNKRQVLRNMRWEPQGCRNQQHSERRLPDTALSSPLDASKNRVTDELTWQLGSYLGKINELHEHLNQLKLAVLRCIQNNHRWDARMMEAAMASPQNSRTKYQSKPMLTSTTPRVSLGGRGGTGHRLYKHTGAQSSKW